MFGNPIPTFDVPSYLVHVDCIAHEIFLLKASCNNLMSVSLGAMESPSDKIYLDMTKGHRPHPIFIFFTKKWIQEVSFGIQQASVIINWLFAPWSWGLWGATIFHSSLSVPVYWWSQNPTIVPPKCTPKIPVGLRVRIPVYRWRKRKPTFQHDIYRTYFMDF
jgi:hypothetical protein